MVQSLWSKQDASVPLLERVILCVQHFTSHPLHSHTKEQTVFSCFFLSFFSHIAKELLSVHSSVCQVTPPPDIATPLSHRYFTPRYAFITTTQHECFVITNSDAKRLTYSYVQVVICILNVPFKLFILKYTQKSFMHTEHIKQCCKISLCSFITDAVTYGTICGAAGGQGRSPSWRSGPTIFYSYREFRGL